jgi:hypothetical protein
MAPGRRFFGRRNGFLRFWSVAAPQWAIAGPGFSYYYRLGSRFSRRLAANNELLQIHVRRTSVLFGRWRTLRRGRHTPPVCASWDTSFLRTDSIKHFPASQTRSVMPASIAGVTRREPLLYSTKCLLPDQSVVCQITQPTRPPSLAKDRSRPLRVLHLPKPNTCTAAFQTQWHMFEQLSSVKPLKKVIEELDLESVVIL